MLRSRKRFLVLVAVAAVALLTWRSWRTGVATVDAAPNRIEVDDPQTRESTMGEVLRMAQDARHHMSASLDDYTARFVKQEVDINGVMSEETELHMKVQTRVRGDEDDAPMRVYLKFVRPESVSGREVIWGEDLHDGRMLVHEAGLLGLMTIPLDPNGLIAMRGQRYPISEIGLLRLVEKLVERGLQDRDDPDVKVTITRDHQVGDVPAELIQVRRSKPVNSENDFSLAEIAIDPERQLVLSYRSFGWPEPGSQAAPLLESYAYFDVKTNVGLTEEDFDPKNAAYQFP